MPTTRPKAFKTPRISDTTFLCEIIVFAAHRLMQLDVDGICGAGHGDRSPERVKQRNGYRDRDWQTRVGTVEVSLAPLGVEVL